MGNETSKETVQDSGLDCLLFIANYHGIAVSAPQIIHALNIKESGMTVVDILKAAQQVGLKSKLFNGKTSQLKDLPVPAIVGDKEGNFFLLARVEEEKLLIYRLEESTPKVISWEEFEQIWSGQAILFKKKGLIDREVAFGLKWFIPTILKYKKPLLLTLIAILTIQVLGIFTPILTQVIIDKALVHNSIPTLDIFIIGMAIIVLFELVMGLAKNNVFTNTTSKIDVILGARLYKHLLSLPLRYFESRRVGDTVARVREVDNIRSFLTGTPMTSILDVSFILLYIIVLFVYSVPLTCVVLLSLPVFALVSLVITPIFRYRLDERFNTGADSQSFLVESVTGMQTVKALAIEPQMQEEWENRLAAYAKAGYKTSVLSNHAGVIGQFVQRVFDVLILWMGAKMVMTGQLTIGELIAFRMLSGRVSTPVLRLVQLWQEFQQASLSIRRLGDIFNTKAEPQVNNAKTNLPAIRGQIAFDKVCFRYQLEQDEVIRDMSFRIPAGAVIGIVGRSGSGKSTISKLIQRLYIPERGKISVDGLDIAMADPMWLRRQIGVVLQENFLFNMSIKDNIAIHNPTASMEKIIQVAKIAGAHDFILELSEGYETQVGEMGVGLSGGQKQRVAIARALLNNPRILIFDEATSALDYESEHIIQNNLKQICAGRTVLLIAHRLSTIQDADRVMVIDKGRLAEFGTHEQLLQKQGLFYHLCKQQERGEVS